MEENPASLTWVTELKLNHTRWWWNGNWLIFGICARQWFLLTSFTNEENGDFEKLNNKSKATQLVSREGSIWRQHLSDSKALCYTTYLQNLGKLFQSLFLLGGKNLYFGKDCSFLVIILTFWKNYLLVDVPNRISFLDCFQEAFFFFLN